MHRNVLQLEADVRADGVARADLAGTDAAAISSSDAQSVSSMD